VRGGVRQLVVLVQALRVGVVVVVVGRVLGGCLLVRVDERAVCLFPFKKHLAARPSVEVIGVQLSQFLLLRAGVRDIRQSYDIFPLIRCIQRGFASQRKRLAGSYRGAGFAQSVLRRDRRFRILCQATLYDVTQIGLILFGLRLQNVILR
jgi:hypothetical protein